MTSASQSAWGLRVLALVVAVVLWFTVSDRDREQSFDTVMPVSIRYAVPEGFLLLEPTEQVRVGLRGPSSRINQLRPEDVQVLVELEPPTTPDGQVEVTLRPEEHVRLPFPNMQVLTLEPGHLQLTLDHQITREVEVRPRITGEPAAGAKLASHQVTPAKVTVRGPASHLPATFSLSTTPIELGRRAQEFAETVAVVSPDPLVQVVRPRLVRVNVRMEGGPQAEDGEEAS